MGLAAAPPAPDAGRRRPRHHRHRLRGEGRGAGDAEDVAGPAAPDPCRPAGGASVTTAQHAALLRGLVDWAAALPCGVLALRVYEDLEPGVLAAGLVVAGGRWPR
ncbi:hypothetical protein AB0J52_06715 [Spirillospora sp. NPDC049652]